MGLSLSQVRKGQLSAISYGSSRYARTQLQSLPLRGIVDNFFPLLFFNVNIFSHAQAVFFMSETSPRVLFERQERKLSFCCPLVCPPAQGSSSLHRRADAAVGHRPRARADGVGRSRKGHSNNRPCGQLGSLAQRHPTKKLSRNRKDKSCPSRTGKVIE